MAIYHLSMKPISRGQGRSAVAAAAYRSGQSLTDERQGLTFDYTRKRGVEHSEIVLPEGSRAEWARDRAALWNAAENAENRKDARTAREFEIALPHELTHEQRLELVRMFSRELAERYGTAVDFAIHAPDEKTDNRNHHAHVMMTTRTVDEHGLGQKTLIEQENRKLRAQGLPSAQDQLRDIRLSWEEMTNRELARAGIDARVDHRSHTERGLEIEPTQHVGVHATQIDRQGRPVSRTRLDADAARHNAALIREKPDQVLTFLTQEKSVFDRHDVAKALHRYIDDPEAYQRAYASVMASRELVQLQAEGQDGELAKYSTREMVTVERTMARDAQAMAETGSHAVRQRHVDHALKRHDHALRVRHGAAMSAEQREAVHHVTGQAQISAVVGLAGAGKSTMLAAAREAWEAQGYRVRGGALAGKAAEGLEESAGIESRTLASYQYSWQNGRDRLEKGDVLVIDEAGMIGSRQLAKFVGEAKDSGAKIVLVGDPDQLQAIGAGAPFRAIAERTGFAVLENVVRQRDTWQRDASRAFAKHRTTEALSAYDRQGAVRFSRDTEQARADLVRDYMADTMRRPGDSRIALAHRRADVKALNETIRAARQQDGQLGTGRTYQTDAGARSFAAGDRLLFLENNRDLGVKNGMLATVERADDGQIHARLDAADKDGQARTVLVRPAEYAAIDHGYATTIYKAQGTTVDRSFVLASRSMDRHLAYVAMTRHRDAATLYAGRDELKDRKALAAALGRARAKETTLDYDPPAPSPDRKMSLADHLRAAQRQETEDDREAGTSQETPPAASENPWSIENILRRGRGPSNDQDRDPGRERDRSREP